MRPDEIIKTLERAGFEARYVGGCVRDTLLNRPIHDWDIASQALPEDVALVHAGAEGREIYVTLRNYRNETRKESLSLKGWKLTETDLLRRPLGEPKERLELTLEPLSLAMIRMTPEET